MKKIFFTAMFAASLAGVAQTTYTVDKNHTKIGFIAKHFGISEVDGKFNNADASLKSSKEDFSDAVIEMTADVKSIDTDVEMRDNDLRSENWLDAEKYPKITFKSTSFKKVSDKNYKLAGNITIKGVTKPIVFDVVYNGKHMNPMSKKNSVGFTITGKLNKNDFGVGKDSPAVGDEIQLRANTEFIIN